MGNDDAALGHHLDQIPVTQPIGEVPPHTQLDDFGLKSATPIDRVACYGLLIWASHKNQNSMVYPEALNAPAPKMPPLVGGCQVRLADVSGLPVDNKALFL